MAGAVVSIEGLATAHSVVTDENGAFSVRALALGAYWVRVSHPGFRMFERRIVLNQGGPRRLEIRLQLGVVKGLAIIRPELADAFEQASSVAHLRFERAIEPEACGDVVSTAHLVSVLAVGKGRLPPTIWFTEIDAGACVHEGVLVRGALAASPSLAEYVVFLKPDGEDSFQSVAGAETMLEVSDGRIVTEYQTIRPGMTVAETFDALRDLRPATSQPLQPRISRPDGGK
jgi:hypothetical protein